MFINEVISYNGAWEELNKKNPSILQDIQDSLLQCSIEEWASAYQTSNSNFRWRSLENNLNEKQWEVYQDTKAFIHISKENIFINVTLDLFVNLIETLYFDLVLSNRHAPDYLPIIITDNISVDSENHLQQKMLSKGSFENNELTVMGLGHVIARMALLDNLSLEFPFLIFGVDREQADFYVHSFESKHKISTNRERFNQCITFAPEYYQAGLSILNYFGTVLRNKYPEQKATVKIEQHENMVRMIVE